MIKIQKKQVPQDVPSKMKNQHSKAVFKSSPFKAFHHHTLQSQFVSPKNQIKEESLLSSSSQLLLQESFVDDRSSSNINVKLQYLIGLKKGNNDQIKQLHKQVKTLREQVHKCVKKIGRSLKKNQQLDNSLKKLQNTMKSEETRKTQKSPKKNKAFNPDQRLFQLGKFVRKNTTPNKMFFGQINYTKHSQNKTVAKSPVTPNVHVHKTSEYFDYTEKKDEKKGRKKQLKELKNQLDALIYKELKSQQKEKKKVRKQIKQITKRIEEAEEGNKKMKCNCMHQHKRVPSEFMKF